MPGSHRTMVWRQDRMPAHQFMAPVSTLQGTPACDTEPVLSSANNLLLFYPIHPIPFHPTCPIISIPFHPIPSHPTLPQPIPSRAGGHGTAQGTTIHPHALCLTLVPTISVKLL